MIMTRIFCHIGLGVVKSWFCQSSFLSCLAFFCDTRDISFGTLKIGQNNLEIANLEFESHSFLKNHVLLPIEQAEKNLYERVYQDTNFKICLRLFACKGNILYKEHIVHCSFSSSEEIWCFGDRLHQHGGWQFRLCWREEGSPSQDHLVRRLPSLQYSRPWCGKSTRRPLRARPTSSFLRMWDRKKKVTEIFSPHDWLRCFYLSESLQ